jgi:DNA-binding NarL/FixJ family response regulator
MVRRNNESWSAEEEAVLREMAAQGKKRLLIALRLRRSESAVKRRATVLGLRLPPNRRS